MLFELLSPLPEEEPVDTKAAAKKDPKAAKGKQEVSQFTEEEEAQFGSKKIFLECKSDTEPKEIRFKLSMVYQGPDYEDPNPPEEDLTAKKPAKGKGAAVPEEPEIRMITPDPVPIEQEGGRVFSLELTTEVKIVLEEKKEEAAGLKESSQDIPEDFYEKKKIRFYADQRVKPTPIETIVQSI